MQYQITKRVHFGQRSGGVGKPEQYRIERVYTAMASYLLDLGEGDAGLLHVNRSHISISIVSFSEFSVGTSVIVVLNSTARVGQFTAIREDCGSETRWWWPWPGLSNACSPPNSVFY